MEKKKTGKAGLLQQFRGCISSSWWDTANMTGLTLLSVIPDAEENVQIRQFFPKGSPCCKKMLVLFKNHSAGGSQPSLRSRLAHRQKTACYIHCLQELEINDPDKKWTSNTQTALLMMLKEVEDKALCTQPGRSTCSCIPTGGCARSPASPCSAAAAAPGCHWTSGAAARGKPDQGWANISFHWSFQVHGWVKGSADVAHVHDTHIVSDATGGRECGSPGTELIPLGLNPVCFWDFQTAN